MDPFRGPGPWTGSIRSWTGSMDPVSLLPHIKRLVCLIAGSRFHVRIALRVPSAHGFVSLACAFERVHVHNMYKMVAFSKRLGLQERQIIVFYSETNTGT